MIVRLLRASSYLLLSNLFSESSRVAQSDLNEWPQLSLGLRRRLLVDTTLASDLMKWILRGDSLLNFGLWVELLLRQPVHTGGKLTLGLGRLHGNSSHTVQIFVSIMCLSAVSMEEDGILQPLWVLLLLRWARKRLIDSSNYISDMLLVYRLCTCSANIALILRAKWRCVSFLCCFHDLSALHLAWFIVCSRCSSFLCALFYARL